MLKERWTMEITRDTKLLDIIEEYPWLMDEAEAISDKLKMLDSPLGKILLKKATIADASSRTGIPEEKIISKIEGLILEHARD